MSTTGESQPQPDGRRCPVNHAEGRPVGRLTVKAVLTESALGRVRTAAHHFCPTPTCDVVYFDAEGSVFTTRELRVPVWQKEPFGSRVICYCFGVSEDTIGVEIQSTGRSAAPERIREHIAAGRCACEVRNPRGVCCLRDVGVAIAAVRAALAAKAPAATEP